MKRLVPGLRYLLRFALITLVYVIAGKIGLAFAVINPSASAIWPPTGIALATIILYGLPLWPAVLTGAFIVNVTTTGTPETSLAIAVGNTFEAVIGAFLVFRFASGKQLFSSPMNVIGFSVLAGALATMISPTIGVYALMRGGFIDSRGIFDVWMTWWLGDMGSVLSITPVILLWTRNHFAMEYKKKWFQVVAYFVLLYVSGYMVFTDVLPFPYLVLPALLWSAILLTQRETSIGVLIITVMAVVATFAGSGPFIDSAWDINRALLLLQLFVCIIAAMSLIVSSVVSQYRDVLGKLLDSEHRFRALTEKSSGAISLIDEAAHIIYTSPSTKTVLGYTQEEFVGSEGFSYLYPRDITKVQKLLASVITHPNKPYTILVRMKHKSGSWLWVEATFRNLMDDPIVRGIIVNYHDITKRRELELAKDEFLMIAAHQLRTPLTKMRWHTEILLAKRNTYPQELAGKLKGLHDYNTYLIRLVNDLIETSKVIQGEIPLTLKSVSPTAIVQKQITAVRALAQERTISLKVNSESGIPSIETDAERLGDIIQNLLTNAIKYTPPEGIVTVSVSRDSYDIHIAVQDTGIGIPKPEQSLLFTKFFRTSMGSSFSPDGTGLGLFIAKSYLDRMKGTIRVESPVETDGTGTIMHIALPMSAKKRHKNAVV